MNNRMGKFCGFRRRHFVYVYFREIADDRGKYFPALFSAPNVTMQDLNSLANYATDAFQEGLHTLLLYRNKDRINIICAKSVPSYIIYINNYGIDGIPISAEGGTSGKFP